MVFGLINGDARAIPLADRSVQCCVTSPPYYGLRDYGIDGQIGLERTPEEYVSSMVGVFREVRRVLADDGTLWLNIGDSYATNRSYQVTPTKWKELSFGKSNASKVPDGLKPKDLIGIPWMLAFALRADGWWLRSDIIWSKPNPMPESVRDRPTKAHEYLFLLSKNERYYYDALAIADPLKRPGEAFRKTPAKFGGALKFAEAKKQSRLHSGNKYTGTATGTRNRRTVWTVATTPCSEAHFAVYPISLVEPCVLAGCPEGGTVLDPFSGAGTTGLAALKNGRNYVGIELNPEYNKIARSRAEKFNLLEKES